MNREIITYSEDEFIQTRKEFIGGSEIGVLIGADDWSSPLKIYMDKRDLLDEPEPTLPMKLGSLMETTIATLYKEEVGEFPIRPGHGERVLVKNHKPYFGFHPDGWFMDDDGKITKGWECKFSTRYDTFTDFQEDIPLLYRAQCQWGMHLMEVDSFDLVVLIGNRDLKIYTIEKDQEMIDSLVEAAEHFWNNHVLAENPPDGSGFQDDAKLLQKLYEDLGGISQPTEEILLTAAELSDARKRYKEVEAEKIELENIIKSFMKNDSIMVGDTFKISFKKSKDGSKTNWEQVAYRMLHNIKELTGREAQVCDAEFDELVKQHTEVKPGSRRFLFTDITPGA